MIGSLSTTTHTLLVEEITASLASANLVVLQVPRYSRVESWCEGVAKDISSRLRVGALNAAPVIEKLDPLAADPKEIILGVLGSPNSSSFSDAIEDFGVDRVPVFVSLDFNQDPSPQWCQVFESLAKAYSNLGNPDIGRPLLVFSFGVDFRDALRGDTGIKIVDYWNIYPPNDLRSLVHRLLPTKQWSYFEHIWRASAYTALANGDRDLLERVCINQPNDLEELANFICAEHQSLRNDQARKNRETEIDSFLITPLIEYTDTEKVPNKLRADWQTGRIIGLTTTGEPQYSWYHLVGSLSDRGLRTHLRFLVWQEQLVSIFPLLIRMSGRIAQHIAITYGQKWSELLPSNHKDAINTVEPSVILDTFANNKRTLASLPSPINDILHSLRKLRNKLAHTEALEKREINELWEKHQSPRLSLNANQ